MVVHQAGSDRRPESARHPQTRPPSHPASPLFTLLSQAAAGPCVLAPVQVLVLRGSRSASDPGPAMLDVVIISSPLDPHLPPGAQSLTQEELPGLWRGSGPGEQLCGLEAAGRGPLRAPLHRPRQERGSSKPHLFTSAAWATLKPPPPLILFWTRGRVGGRRIRTVAEAQQVEASSVTGPHRHAEARPPGCTRGFVTFVTDHQL
ncbi:unnamed protein product [Pleuronectes platessa]|uniref:Uncharacterized protein n=1 Tax=Pleuronectes platessa TaxID=8262 RepID=A0A9N7YXV7_PLEPL|nr:unnamed protein product [Pleuronectes platessa]